MNIDIGETLTQTLWPEHRVAATMMETVAPGYLAEAEVAQRAVQAVDYMREHRAMPTQASREAKGAGEFSLWDRGTLNETLTSWMEHFQGAAAIYRQGAQIYEGWRLSEKPLHIYDGRPVGMGEAAWVVEVQLTDNVNFPAPLFQAINLYHGKENGGRGYNPFFWCFTRQLGAYAKQQPGDFLIKKPFAEGWLNDRWAAAPVPFVERLVRAW